MGAAPYDATRASPVPRRAPDPATLRAYKARRLVRVGATGVTGYVGSVGGHVYGSVASYDTWKVTDGGGAPLTALELARVTGDGVTRARLERGVTTGWVVGGGLAVLGIGILAGGADAQARDEDGFVAITLGSAVLASAVLPPVLAIAASRDVRSAYGPAEADRRIEAYNARLRAELGLSEEDVRDIDLFSAAPAPSWVARAPAPPVLVLTPLGLVGTF